MKHRPVLYKTIPAFRDLQKAFPKVRTYLFDMDGTLFNTEPYHSKAMLQMAADYNIKAPFSAEEVHELLVGRADHLVYEIIKNWEGFPKHWSAKDFVDEKNKNIIHILQKVKPDDYFFPDMKALLGEARKAGFFIGLVTSSEKAVTKELLEITGLVEFFNFVLTRDDCPEVKPHPWPYLKAIETAGCEKEEALVFEDSSVGIEAAVSSGANVIKVGWY